ncbi:MAG: BMP family ABC transporter substrate-binding protein [Candidatus Kapaibacterium sp.]
MKYVLIFLLITITILSGCSENDETISDYSAGLILDADGIQSHFNALAWRGIQRARSEYGINVSYRVSESDKDYESNFLYYIQNDANIIFTLGFLLKDKTIEYANNHPNTNFAMVDVYNETSMNNLVGISFEMENACFLAGYLAAGFTKTGIVATFGGMDIPPINDFLRGFENGINHYNQTNNTNVILLGRNLYPNDFESIQLGRLIADSLIAEGADIIFPVTGTAAQGVLQSVNEHDIYFIGPDVDWHTTFPDNTNNVIISVLKNIDTAIFNFIASDIRGSFQNGNYIGNLKNGGVGLSPYYEFSDQISDSLKQEIESLKASFIQ